MADANLLQQDTVGNRGRTQGRPYAVDREWLDLQYSVKARPVGDIAAEIGCCVETLNQIIKKLGIPRRDGRKGRVVRSARAPFNLVRAAWLYEICRMNATDIGSDLGVECSTVLRRLREGGIRIRHHNETKRGARAKNRIVLNERKVVSAYRADGGSVDSVADKFSVSRAVIERILKSNMVKMKPLSEVRPYSGDSNPNWREDISDAEREARRDAFKQSAWRMAVYERDGFTCQKCGDDSGGNLNAHHVEPHCANKELRWSVSNGITLCKTCHTQFHRRYGVKRCGRPELEEYLAAAEAVSRAKAAVRSNSR